MAIQYSRERQKRRSENKHGGPFKGQPIAGERSPATLARIARRNAKRKESAAIRRAVAEARALKEQALRAAKAAQEGPKSAQEGPVTTQTKPTAPSAGNEEKQNEQA